MERLLDDIPELEHRLLLYAAGELPVDEAAAVERELAVSAPAREALAQIRGLLSEMDSALSSLGVAEAVPARSMRRATDRAVRSVFAWVEVEKQARVLRKSSRHLLAEGMVWRYARWPLATAAVLVVGLMIWTFGTQPPQDQGALAELKPPPQMTTAEVAGPDTGSTQRAPEAQLEQIAALFDNPTRPDGSDPYAGELAGGLTDELAALRLLEEPDYE